MSATQGIGGKRAEEEKHTEEMEMLDEAYPDPVEVGQGAPETEVEKEEGPEYQRQQGRGARQEAESAEAERHPVKTWVARLEARREELTRARDEEAQIARQREQIREKQEEHARQQQILRESMAEGEALVTAEEPAQLERWQRTTIEQSHLKEEQARQQERQVAADAEIARAMMDELKEEEAAQHKALTRAVELEEEKVQVKEEQAAFNLCWREEQTSLTRQYEHKQREQMGERIP